MHLERTDAVREVVEASKDGLFGTANVDELGTEVVVLRSTDDVEEWLYSDEQPGVADAPDYDIDGDNGLCWQDLRARMASKLLKDTYRVLGDRYENVAGRNALNALEDQIRNEIEQNLRASLPAGLASYENDVHPDLVHCAESGLMCSSGPHARFFELLFRAYKAGLFPCGWQGKYPDGRLVVYVHESDK